jgi:eukaryotic-like serine/threonine-protein kinase
MVLPLEGRLLDGKFRLVRRLGSGGMASVWLALNLRVDKQVALKLIRPEVLRSEDMVARFRSEAKAAGRIDHPNICEILDYGVGPVGPYIVLEYLRGRNLAEIIKQDGPLPVPTAVMIVRRTLAALDAVHEQGIVHRDLKPENIFLHKPSGGEPIVKLMDFGVAKLTDGSAEIQTEHGALLGTPEYMAPEQFKGASNADRRTDMWGLGAILYRALTGKNAFGGPTVAATLMMVSSDDPTPIRDLAPDVPAALEQVVMRCLAKDPADRYQSAAELDEALAPFDEEESQAVRWPEAALLVSGAHPITRLPASGSQPLSDEDPLHTTQEWAKGRAPSRFGLRAVLLLLLMAAIGGWWLTQRAERDPQSPGPQEPAGVHRGGEDAPTPEAAASTGASSEPEDEGLSEDTLLEIASGETGLLAADTGDMSETDGDASEQTTDASEATTTKGATTHTQPIEEVEDPPGTARSGRYITIIGPTPKGDHAAARKYCEGLASISHLGVRRWTLANPSVTTSFAGIKGVPAGRYWTSARWRGRAVLVALPSGKKSSVKAERGGFRPFCVARYP